ncbi:MAG TPA: hypothetical protein VFO36_05130, partial [Nitrospiraceae bacterium]|nr:hypothetical protein [Nitrospiraceae bacterium]
AKVDEGDRYSRRCLSVLKRHERSGGKLRVTRHQYTSIAVELGDRPWLRRITEESRSSIRRIVCSTSRGPAQAALTLLGKTSSPPHEPGGSRFVLPPHSAALDIHPLRRTVVIAPAVSWRPDLLAI